MPYYERGRHYRSAMRYLASGPTTPTTPAWPRPGAIFLRAIALAACLTAAGADAAPTLPRLPFARTSIWNRRVPRDASFAPVQDAIFGAPAAAPHSVGVDLVTLCSTSENAPLVPIERSQGWTYPLRAESSGQRLYERRLEPDACTDVGWNRIGNGLFVLFDPPSGTADLGVGGWRDPGGTLLNVAPDGPGAHGLDVRRGDGLRGYGRASSLPALGGLLRSGELTSSIRHAVAVILNPARFSSARHFVWPATTADGLAAQLYRGPDVNYTIGTLLAIPRSTRLRAYSWRTKQGLRLALAAQRYGWYVVDSVPSDQIQFAIENDAARRDLGLAIDPATGAISVDPAKVDAVGLTADVVQTLTLVEAVASNAPARR